MSNEEHKILETLRRYFGITTANAFSAYRILRIDSNVYYYLASFSDERNKRTKVVIVNSNFEVTQFADVHQLLTLEKPEAVTAAERGGAIVELIWKPCKISYSPFYPFWRVSAGDEIYYVNLNGKHFSETDLDKKRPG